MHNHKTTVAKIIKTVTYIPTVLKLHVMKEIHSRDVTILIALAIVVYMTVHYSSLFQYFFINLLASLLLVL